MRRFTLDTTCIIAAVKGESAEPAARDIEQLVEFARSGRIDIAITSGFEVDQRRASDERRRANLEWLSRAPILSIPGPFRLGMSFLDRSDVLVEDHIPAIDEAISKIVVGVKPGDARSKRMQDVHHLTAHYMAERDAFVTSDDDDMIKKRKRERLRSEVGIVVLSPSEAVALAPSN
jgi:hypothetical protein